MHGKLDYQRLDGTAIPVYLATVEVYDDDGNNAFDPDDLLATTTTDADGMYDVTFFWPGVPEAEPDLYVKFIAESPRVAVFANELDQVFGRPYSWETSIRNNYSGSDLLIPLTSPGDDAGERAAAHAFTTINRGGLWLADLNAAWSAAQVDVFTPYADDNSFWSPTGGGRIFMADGQKWQEDTILHEYGHHWVHQFGAASSSGYCNEICDPEPDNCRHCDWCSEEPIDAWNEGFSDWLADAITRSFAFDYDDPSQYTRDREWLKGCNEASFMPVPADTCDCSPWDTEGFLGALLRDVEDTNYEDDPRAPGTWRDQMAEGAAVVLTVASTAPKPDTPAEFVDRFGALYPGLKPLFWETAKNSSYEIDTAAPGAVTGLMSTSHEVSDPASTDNTIDYVWNPAPDDWSGVVGFGIFISLNSPGMPSTVQDIPNTSTYTTPPLAPGAYYFTIRAVDRTGKWSASYADFGPIDIRAPEPVNLVYYPRPGWAHELVPRATNDATISAVGAPTTLTGNSSSTYWNLSGRNTGDDPTGSGFDVHLLVDEQFRMTASWGGSVAPLGAFHFLNQGPLNIRGGRHTVEGVLEAGEDIAESSESDNLWAHQWVWTPLTLTAGTRVSRAAPPVRDAGWSAVVDGSPTYYNCEGFRFNTSGWWNAIWVYAPNDSTDIDCRLHTESAGATSGFTSANLGYSTRIAGLLDAVIVNKNVAAAGDYDVGAVNANGGVNSFFAKHVTSVAISIGDSLPVPLAANEMVALREFHVGAGDLGPISIKVEAPAGSQPVTVRWFDQTFATGDLLDDDATATTDETGYARLDVTASGTGYQCVMIQRDPEGGAGALTVHLEVEKTPPDLLPLMPAGWHAALTPRPADDGTPASVPAPATLPGDVSATYWNIAMHNNSPTAMPGHTTRVYVDGVSSLGVGFGGIAANADRLHNSGSARTVRGGRHTAVLSIDDPLGVEEKFEDNNRYGEQWVWTPAALVLDAPLTRSAPPDRTAGWSDVATGEETFFNCDGLRTPVFAPSGSDGYWGAVAVMPGGASDVDVRLHELSTGAKDGFAVSLASSAWGEAESDYVLANFRLTAFRAFDAGVLLGGGAESHTIEATSSRYRANLPQGIYGPYVLAAGRILDLHEFTLQAGMVDILLENVAGAVDWGMALHGGTVALLDKSGALVDGSAWLAGPGGNEHMVAVVPADGHYCLAVWKSAAASLAAAGTYQLTISGQPVDVPGTPSPEVTRLLPARPNPFAASARLDFDLAEGADVRLELFDVGGARVRTLVAGWHGPGRHPVAWDGRTDQGRPAPAGIYLARFVAGPYRSVQRVAKVR
ncbi:MAG: FlgD immunoglobulin-like domain containing protein [Candidatus Eiseniibacteriota bacterium]